MRTNKLFKKLNKLYESVSIDNPYLTKALMLFKNDPLAKGVVVSYKDKNTHAEVEVCQTYHT